MIKSFIISVAFLAIFCCRGKHKEEFDCTDLPLKITGKLDSISLYADSALSVYQESIEYLRGKPDDKLYIDVHFQKQMSSYFSNVVNKVDQVNKIYVARNLSQKCYDLFTQRLTLSSERLKKKQEELEKMGFSFELHNPYAQIDSVKEAK